MGQSCAFKDLLHKTVLIEYFEQVNHSPYHVRISNKNKSGVVERRVRMQSWKKQLVFLYCCAQCGTDEFEASVEFVSVWCGACMTRV